MYCNYCGKVIQDDAAVCAYCGTRVGLSIARKRLGHAFIGGPHLGAFGVQCTVGLIGMGERLG